MCLWCAFDYSMNGHNVKLKANEKKKWAIKKTQAQNTSRLTQQKTVSERDD